MLIHAISNSITYIYVAFSITIYVQLLFIALWMTNGEYHMLLCLKGWILWPIKLFWMKIVWYDFIRNFMWSNIVQTERKLGFSCFQFILFWYLWLQHILEEREKIKYLVMLRHLLFYLSRIRHYLWVCLRTITVGSHFATVRLTMIRFYDPCPVGLSTLDLWCVTVATRASFLYSVRF
jgi:hypothetical protein